MNALNLRVISCSWFSSVIPDAPLEDLQETTGLGTVAPVALRIVREAATLYLQQTAEHRESLAEPEAIRRFWRARLGHLDKEVFEVASLDSGLCLLRNGIETLEEGTVDRATIYPRSVVEATLKRSACAVILAHNHPIGDVRPSEQDKKVTRAAALVASAVQLRVPAASTSIHLSHGKKGKEQHVV